MNNDSLFLKADELYEKGEFSSALEKFRKAAQNGDTTSMLRMASMYTCGEGVKCDYDKALEWELKAIKAGDTAGMVNIGITYRIKGDIRSAKSWFEKAFKAGDGSAALQLAKLYMVSEKESDTVKFYLKQAIKNKNMCGKDIEEAEKLLLEL